MRTASIEFEYKGRLIRLDRKPGQEPEAGKLFFANKTWEIEIIRESGENRLKFFRVKLEHWSIKKNEDGTITNHNLFYYWCTCYPEECSDSCLLIQEVYDPAGCKKIRNSTKLLVISPVVNAIYQQLKEEMAVLPTQYELRCKIQQVRELLPELLRLDDEILKKYPYNEDDYILHTKSHPRIKVIWSLLEDLGVMIGYGIDTESWLFRQAFGENAKITDIIY